MSDIDYASVFAPELSKIEDEGLRVWTRTALEHAPSDFYFETSSTSGRFHPKDEHGLFGRVIHTKRAYKVLEVLLDAYYDRYGVRSRSEMRAAILLHDAGCPICLKEHQYVLWSYYEEILGKEFVEAAPKVFMLIRSHMGRWSPTPPLTEMEWIVHLADNIASKVHEIVNVEGGAPWSMEATHCGTQFLPTKEEGDGYEWITNCDKSRLPQIISNPDGTKSLRWSTDPMNQDKSCTGPFLGVLVKNDAYAKDGMRLGSWTVALYVKRVI